MIGVGLGPGDPELLTLKAVRVLGAADVVAHFAKRGNESNARATASAYLRPGALEMTFNYPVTTEIPKSDPLYEKIIASFFDESARAVEEHLRAGRTVAVLSAGDPLFYGSYMHLHVRLADRFPTEVVAGVTGMSGCWSAMGLPIVQGDDVLAILPGTLPEEDLARRLTESQACVVMKVGRNLGKVRRALQTAGRLGEAVFVEQGTKTAMAASQLNEKVDDEAAYFSLVLVPGWRTRP